MGWSDILALVLKYGPEAISLAEFLWQKITAGTPPTQADWDQLKALANNTARSQMTAALLKAGIDPNSEQGKALLALVP